MCVSTYYTVANTNQSTRTFGKTSLILIIQTLINRVYMIESKLFQYCVYVNVITIYNTIFFFLNYLASPTYWSSRTFVIQV